MIGKSHRNNSVAWLNDLCGFCGKRPVAKLKKAHLEEWIARHLSGRSPATWRSVIAVVRAAFNRAEAMLGVANPLKWLKKPRLEPRLRSQHERPTVEGHAIIVADAWASMHIDVSGVRKATACPRARNRPGPPGPCRYWGGRVA